MFCCAATTVHAGKVSQCKSDVIADSPSSSLIMQMSKDRPSNSTAADRWNDDEKIVRLQMFKLLLRLHPMFSRLLVCREVL
jgi:hypothetical protein